MLGDLLKRLRERAQLGVDDVVEQTGCAKSTVYLWESRASRPEPERLFALLKLYGASAEEQAEAWSLRASPMSTASAPTA